MLQFYSAFPTSIFQFFVRVHSDKGMDIQEILEIITVLETR